MYIKIAKVGDIDKDLNIEFEKINSPLRVMSYPGGRDLPFVCAIIENKTKSSEVSLAEGDRLYLPDFWKDGVCMATGSFTDITQLVTALDFWLRDDIVTKQLSERFPSITPTDHSSAFESGIEIEYGWQKVLNAKYTAELKSFISLAMEDSVLNQLFPYTSLNTLCFSRCTGYPYTNDTPAVEPVGKDIFRVRLMNGVILLDSGTAAEALVVVKQNIPLNVGRAVKGTAKDLKIRLF